MPGPIPKTLQDVWNDLLREKIVTPNDCWVIIKGHKTGIGYRSRRADGESWYVHQIAEAITNGPIYPGTIVRHTCDVPNCINPAHLLRGTHTDNVNDKVARKRHCFGTKHYRAKLTESDVKAIRESTETYAELSRKYGISRGGIHNIKTGRSWKWL